MVYCVKCGTQNPDDSRTCSKCGASLYVTRESEHYRRMENECFGIPRGSKIVGLAIGVIVLFWGMILLLQQTKVIPETVEVWPFALVIFGILIVIGAIYGMRRRY